MELISAAFFCIAAVGYLVNDSFGLSAGFRKGFAAIPELLLLMTGFMVLAPWIAVHAAPLAAPYFAWIGCDPSIFAGLLLSCDAGGAVLAEQIALNPQAGLYTGMVVASFFGCTITGTIPFALNHTHGAKRQAAVNGLLSALLMLPAACLFTGFCCGFPFRMMLRNTIPVLVFSLFLLFLFKCCTVVILPLFTAVSFAVRGTALFGLCTAVLQEASGNFLLDNLTPLDEVFPVICRIGIFLAGILPAFALLERLLQRPIAVMSRRLKLQPEAVASLIVTTANSIPTLLHLEDLDERGITLNTAFAVLSSYTVGDFLAFSLQFAPEIAFPMLAGRLLSGFLVLILSYRFLPADSA